MIKKNKKIRTEDVAERLTLEPHMCDKLCWGQRERVQAEERGFQAQGLACVKASSEKQISWHILVSEGRPV